VDDVALTGSDVDKRYAAFLSYSHAADAGLSLAVRDALQQLNKPWHKPRALRVFRDNSSLAATEALWPSIQAAMDSSHYFILLASPQATTSEWVAREVTYWLDHNPPNTLLIAVTDGELHWNPTTGDFDPTRTTCLPPPLYGRLTQEPRWVDLRNLPTDQLTLRNTTFRDRIADLAAPLHGLSKDDLVGADIRQHRRTQHLIRATIATLTALATVATASAVVAISGFVVAAREQARAEAAREVARAQEALAEERQRDALIRQLLSEADVLRSNGNDPAAARLSLAALHLRDDAQTRAGLLNVTIDRTIAALLSGLSEAYDLAYTPDGTTLIVAGAVTAEDGAPRGALHLWDLRDQYRPRRLGELRTDHSAAIFDIAVSPDGRLLASASLDGRVSLWDLTDLTNPTPVGEPLAAHAAAVSSVRFAAGRPLLITASLNGEVALWDIADPARPERVGEPLRHDSQVWAAALAPDGDLLAVGCRNGTLTLWDIGTIDRPVRVAEPVTAHTNAVTTIEFSPDGERLATGSLDTQVRLWSVTDPTTITTVATRNLDNPIRSIAFSPDGTELRVSGHGRAVDLVLVQTESDGGVYLAWIPGQEVLEQSDVPVIMQRVVYSPDGNWVAAVARHGVVGVWAWRLQTIRGENTPFSGTIAIPSPDGRSVLVGDRAGTVARWDVTDPANAQRLAGPVPAHGDEIAAIAFSRDGALAATVGFLDSVRLWDVSDPDELTPLGEPLRLGDVRAVTFFADGRTLATASTDRGVELWDISDPARPAPLGPLEPDQRTWALAYAPDRALLAAGSINAPTTLWDVSDPRQPRRLGEPLPSRRSGTYVLAFSPDGSMLAAGHEDGSLLLWDVTDPTRPSRIGRTIQLHRDNIRSLSFSPDGSLLISGSWDGQSAVLDMGYPANPVEIARGLTSQPTVAFSPTGPTFVTSGSPDGPVQIFDYSLASSHREHLVERACAIAGRGLTEEEWAAMMPTIPYHDTCPAL
jgi:WD40 repeat protein